MKKVLIFILIIVFIVSVTVVGSGEDQPVTNIGWVSDNPEGILNSFDDLVERGLDKVEVDFDTEVEITRYYPENPDEDFDYTGCVSAAAEVNDIVVTAGFYFDQAIQDVAPNYPNTIFITIDFVPMNHEACEYFTNVVSYTFREEEGSFLVGLAAGESTQNKIFGFIGGMDFELINRFECGYRAGVKTVNLKNEVIVDYADSFADKFQGFYYATNQHEIEGANIIYHAAGGTGEGLIESAELFDYWAIGVDVDQSYMSPSNVLCSMVKRVDVAVYTAIESLLTTELIEEHEISLGIVENGVGYSDLAGNLSKKTIKLLDYYIENPITVPSTYEELETFLNDLEK